MRDQELSNLINRSARQQAGDSRRFKIGHVVSYSGGLVNVLFPLDTNDGEEFVIATNIPLSSPWTGEGSGFQFAPIGGSSPKDPTKGEPVLVSMIESAFGDWFVANMLYGINKFRPPSTIVGLQPGEAVFRHQKGGYIKWSNNGDITIYTPENEQDPDNAGSINIQSGRNIGITAAKKISVEAKDGDVSIKASADVSIKADGKVKLETKEIDIDAGSDKLTVNIQAKEDVEVNALRLTTTVNTMNAIVNAQNDILMNGTNIQMTATERLEIKGRRTIVSGEEIIIGNGTNFDNTCNNIRIDANRLRSTGRIKNKVMGTHIVVGSLDSGDGFKAARIDLVTNRGN